MWGGNTVGSAGGEGSDRARKSPISAHGWMGYGYIITDPATMQELILLMVAEMEAFLLAAIVATILVLGGWLSALLVLSLVLEFIIGAITRNKCYFAENAEFGRSRSNTGVFC